MADLPTADEFFTPKDPTDNGQLPTADEFFAPPAPSATDLATKAAGSIITGEGFSNPAVDEFLQKTPVGRIMQSFGSGFAAGGEGGPLGIERGGDVEEALTKAGIFNDHAANENNFLKGVNEAFIRPAAIAIDNEARGAQAAIGAIGGGLMQTAHEVGTAIEGNKTTPLIEQFAEFALMHNAELPMHIEQARSVGAIGESEANYFGLKEPSPQESLARQQASIASEAPEVPEAPAPKDIHTMAREIAPETFEKYDNINTQQDTLRSQLTDLASKRDEEVTTNVPHADELKALDKQIIAITDKVNGVENRLTKRQTAKLEDLRNRFDDLSEKSKTVAGADTPDMADLRSQIQKLDFDKRDLAPDVSSAYKEAQSRIIPETPEETSQPEGQPATSETPSEPDTQLDNISKDVSSKLQAVGRPAEEADASAQLIAQHYKSIADQGWAKGTPEEIYERDAPNIFAGKEKAKKSFTEFNQKAKGKIRLATDDAKAAITLFKSADASTFIHETGHAWLDEMMRYAKADDAPEGLLKDRDTVNKWLGVKEGEEIARAQHEKFARGFEHYLMEGTAPSKELANIFAKFKEWLTNIYKTVQKLKSPITDDIRDVFDRLLSAKPERTVIAPEREAPEESTIHTPQTSAELPSAQATTNEGNATTSASPTESKETTITPEAQHRIASIESKEISPNKTKEGYFIDKNGKINEDALNYSLYNNTPGWLQNYFNEYADKNYSNFGISSEVETLDSMEKLVKATGWTPKEIREMEIGQKRNRLQQLASADLFKQMVDKVKEKASIAAASGDPKVIADFFESTQEHQMLMEAFRDQKAYAAEASRNLGIRRAIKSLTNDAEQFTELFQQITEKNPKDVVKQAEYLQKLITPGTAEKFLKDGSQTPWQKFKNGMLSYYINALISGPITHLRYSVGNALNALWTPLVEIPTAAGIGNIREIITGEVNPNRVYLGEAGAQLHGLLQGSKNGLQAAAQAWKTGVSPALPTEKILDTLGTKTNAIPGKIGDILETPSRAVSAIHSFFKAIRYEQNIQGLAYRNAMIEGIKEGTDAFTNRIAELGTNPTEEMMTQATSEALKELYMSPTDYNSAIGKFQSAVNSNLVAKIFLPFMKIGSEITKNAFLERTPLGLLTEDVRDRAFYAEGIPAGDMQLAKMATGVALMGGMSAMVLEGLATGDGPTDPNKRAVWLLNHRPNSVQIGGITIPYQGLGHLGMLMRFSANMTEVASGLDESESKSMAGGFLESITRSVLDENFMRGMNDLLQAVFHHEEYGENYIKQFATNWLPFSVGLGQVDRLIDPAQRKANDIYEAVQKRIPLLSESLMPERDRFGEILPNGANNRYANDPVVQRMESLNTGIGRIDKKINGVQLTPQQFDDYSRLAGRFTKMRLDSYVAIPQTRELPPEIQIKTMHSMIESSRQQARGIIMMNYPNIMKQAYQNKVGALKR